MSHEEHVRVGWLYLREGDLLEAIRKFREGDRALAEGRGKPEAYHETMTWAYLMVIQERLERSGKELDWEAFSRAHPDLLDRSHPALREHYSQEFLDSERARRNFVMPDRRS